jgi:hypothetical protein
MNRPRELPIHRVELLSGRIVGHKEYRYDGDYLNDYHTQEGHQPKGHPLSTAQAKAARHGPENEYAETVASFLVKGSVKSAFPFSKNHTLAAAL